MRDVTEESDTRAWHEDANTLNEGSTNRSTSQAETPVRITIELSARDATTHLTDGRGMNLHLGQRVKRGVDSVVQPQSLRDA